VIAVHGGFVEVSHDTVTVLSDVAELGDDIDVDRARQSRSEAEQRLGGDESDEAEAALRRADVRLTAANGPGGGGH
jgi:F-type H+-transporting ATPase subunit epsilon